MANGISAIIFDLYGTLINIKTDEQDPALYVELSKFLSYNKVFVEPEELKAFYMDEARRLLGKSRERYPEIDVMKVFAVIVSRYARGKADERLPEYCARLFRALSRKNFEPFPKVYSTLERLRDRYPLALLSDAQRCFTEPEIESLKLAWFFDHIFMSSDYGFRKPDPRYFRLATDALGVNPEDAVYVGDNAYRDLFGAKGAGMRMVLVRSGEKEYQGTLPDAYIEDVSALEDIIADML